MQGYATDGSASKNGFSESDEEYVPVRGGYDDEDDNDSNSRLPRRNISRKPAPDVQLHPPLPLICFRHELLQINEAKTITGAKLPAFENNFGHPDHGPGEPLQDPIRTKGLAKWFIARGNKELNIRTMGYRYKSDGDEPFNVSITDYLVFKSDLFDESGETGVYCSDPPPTPSVTFDSAFESGNLSRAVRVVGRDRLITGRALEYLRSTVDEFSAPTEVHQEYDLTIRNDINTTGNIQWYYFSASSTAADGDEQHRYPLNVRFNLVNMRKKDSLYNYGMKPAVLSSLRQNEDWRHIGDDVCYYRNNICHAEEDEEEEAIVDSGKAKKKSRFLSSLSFTYTFTGPDTVFFAHCYPYTYSDLQRYLYNLEQDSRIREFMFRRPLCNTLAGNRCESLTIATKSRDHREEHSRPAIVVSARVHPGESNSSFIMHGFLEFITSDTPEANLLRTLFVFRVIPMLNPDGVIHGNYRCSLIGTDLNRRYDIPSEVMHPTISAMKNMLAEMHRKRGVLLFLDLHGHSKNKNAFIYGSDVLNQPEKAAKAVQKLFPPEEIEARRVYTRIFPKLLCAISDSSEGGYFSYRDCTFSVSGSKKGTGRVISWKELGIEGAYTIEVSFCGSGNNQERKLLRKAPQLLPPQQQEKWSRKPPLVAPIPALVPASVSASASVPTAGRLGKGKELRGSISRISAADDAPGGATGGAAPTAPPSIFNSEKSPRSLGKKTDKKESTTSGSAMSGTALPGIVGSPPSSHSKRAAVAKGGDARADSQTPPREAARSSSEATANSCSGRDSFSVSAQPIKLTAAAVAAALSEDGKNHRESTVLALDDLLRSYETAVHYTKEDLKNIGRDIAVAILHFANLKVNDPVPEKRIGFYSHLRRSSQQQDTGSNPVGDRKSPAKGIAAAVQGDHRHYDGGESGPAKRRSSATGGAPPRRGSLGTNNDRQYVHDPHVHVFGDSMLEQPLLRPAVFSPDALMSAYNTSPEEMKIPEITIETMNNRLARVKTELAIRRALNADLPQFPGVEELAVECEPELSSEGSDSEPSVDNLPVSKLLGRRKLIDFKNGKNLLLALRKASEKRRKARLVAEAKEAARREAKRQEDERIAAAAAAAVAAAKDVKVKTLTLNKSSSQQGKQRASADPDSLLPYTIKLSPDPLANQVQAPIQFHTIGRGDKPAKVEVLNAERGVKVSRPRRSNDDFFGYKKPTGETIDSQQQQQQQKNVVERPKTANNVKRKHQTGKTAFILVPNAASSRMASAIDMSVPALLSGHLTPFQLHQQHMQRQSQQQGVPSQPHRRSNSTPQLAPVEYDPVTNLLQQTPPQKPKNFLSLVSPSLTATYAFAYPQRPQAP